MKSIRLIFVAVAASVVFHCFAGDTVSTNEASASKSYSMKFIGTAQGPGGQVMLEGRGQCLISNVIVTCYPIASVSSTNIQLKASSTTVSFEVTAATRICADGKKTTIDSFKRGDVVMVATKKTEQRVALSVRKGPMLFAPTAAGPEPQDYDCP